MAQLRSNENNRAPTAASHDGYGCFAHQKSPGQVDRNGLVPICQGIVHHRTAWIGRGGTIDQNVQ